MGAILPYFLNQCFLTSFFYFSGRRIILVIFLMLILVVVLTCFAYLSIRSLSSFFPVFIIILVFAMSTYTLFRLIYFLKLCRKNVAAIILTQDMFIDNMNGLSINWIDIESFRIESIRGLTTVIRINLKERNQYLELIANPIIRMLAKIRLFDLFIIQTNLLKQNINVLYASLTQTLQSKG